MTFDTLWPLLIMLASAFGAATLLVLPSEAVMAAQIKAGPAPLGRC
jgi:membrane protein YqaA with SNARE-associated domain